MTCEQLDSRPAVINTTKKLAIWTGAWVGSAALATLGHQLLWTDNITLSLIAIVINLLLGVQMIRAYIKHLKALDELQQKVQIEAAAITAGTGIVAGSSYSYLSSFGVIQQEADISVLIVIMALAYIAAIIIGMWRYR
ncbi:MULTISPECIES: hypothetical protein [unclassified Pseudoalteromonas]|uniref:hypothetical protein n=1 Tax=unclassified Pseudoalteromonas TaxID=194690 RepID=UPI000CF620F0|nr:MULTISPECIES: hypothetical protein [unclassified Pseudoalteromonas]MBS3798015.1 hypothetical protein [Pseudoalteromonas sp. BDTF-M6]